MIKTQIQLEDWQYAGLKRLSTDDAKSMSALVRRAVSQLLRQLESPSSRSLEEVAGKYTRGELADLKDHDRSWVESIR